MTVEKINLFSTKIWNDKMSILRAVYLQTDDDGSGRGWMDNFYTLYEFVCFIMSQNTVTQSGGGTRTSTRGKLGRLE